MSPINSRTKGKVGERELATLFRKSGFNCRRGQQFKGTPDSPDIECFDLPMKFHHEVKRRERLSIYEALGQATDDADVLEIPVVHHRRNNQYWVTIMNTAHFLDILGYLQKLREDAAAQQGEDE